MAPNGPRAFQSHSPSHPTSPVGALKRSIPKLQTIAVPRSMHTCQVNVSRKVSDRESVGHGGTVPVSGRESVGSDGTVPVTGRESVGSSGTVLNSEQQRLATRIGGFAVTPFHFVIDEGMQPDARNRKSNKPWLLTGHEPSNLICSPNQPRP